MSVYRPQIEKIYEDLKKKMVFLVGPRQVGKTWLSKKVMERYATPVYLNYDNFDDRSIIKKQQWNPGADLLVFDELHKMKGWKNYLKGLFDTKPESLHILVTGSARLETFRQVGDSLAGRYFVHHLLPLSPAEVVGTEVEKSLDHFEKRGGFPEPYLAESSIDADRWRSLYTDALLRTDVLEYETLKDFNDIRNVFESLRRKVGSPFSYSAIARDIETSDKKVKEYIRVLEALYVIFVVKPYSTKVSRSLLKSPKVYFFDTGLVFGDEGVIFENLVATSLLKYTLLRNDYLGETNKLMYMRTKEHKEVDFALVNSHNQLEKLVEAKVSEKDISKNLLYFSEKYHVNSLQVVKHLRQERKEGNVLISRAEDFLKGLVVNQ